MRCDLEGSVRHRRARAKAVVQQYSGARQTGRSIDLTSGCKLLNTRDLLCLFYTAKASSKRLIRQTLNGSRTNHGASVGVPIEGLRGHPCLALRRVRNWMEQRDLRQPA
jgi:hypothetical protein